MVSNGSGMPGGGDGVVPPVPARSGVPLRDRPVSTGTHQVPGPAAQQPARGSTPGKRHCWVAPVEAGADPHPGVVLAWRQDQGTWSAQVAYVVTPTGQEPLLVTQWLDATQVRPA